MPATESIVRRDAADIGFAVVGELTRKAWSTERR